MSPQLRYAFDDALRNDNVWVPLVIGVLSTVGGGLLLRVLKWGKSPASSDAVTVAREALTTADFLFARSAALDGEMGHPWAVGDLKLDHRALDIQLVDARDRIASRRLRKHVDEVRAELQGLFDTRALGRAAVGTSSPRITTDAEVKRKRESNERAERQMQHAHRGSLAVLAALQRLSKVSPRV